MQTPLQRVIAEIFMQQQPCSSTLCAFAEDLNARAVVLQHYGRSMMREMMYGPVTQAVRSSARGLW